MKINWNLANLLTTIRIVLIPFFIYLLIQPEIWMRLTAFAIFAVASITDLVDGYIARRYRQETSLGRFLDPFADKALVVGAFLTFLFLSAQVQLWMVLCIIGRDMLITLLRFLAIRKGEILRTSTFGKVKTTFQMFCIVIIIISFLIISYRERHLINDMYVGQDKAAWSVAVVNCLRFWNSPSNALLFNLASFVPYFLMLFATMLTIISGLRYLYTNYRLLLPPYTTRSTAP